MTNLWLTNIFQIRKCQVTVFKILNLTLHIKLIFWGGDFFFFWGGGGGGEWEDIPGLPSTYRRTCIFIMWCTHIQQGCALGFSMNW